MVSYWQSTAAGRQCCLYNAQKHVIWCQWCQKYLIYWKCTVEFCWSRKWTYILLKQSINQSKITNFLQWIQTWLLKENNANGDIEPLHSGTLRWRRKLWSAREQQSEQTNQGRSTWDCKKSKTHLKPKWLIELLSLKHSILHGQKTTIAWYDQYHIYSSCNC